MTHAEEQSLAAEIEESAAATALLLESLRRRLAAHRLAVSGLRECLASARGTGAAAPEADEVIEFITSDDELMADLDAIVTLDATSLAAALARAGQASSRAVGVEGCAERAVRAVYEGALARLRSAGTATLAEAQTDRCAVYQLLLAAVTESVAWSSAGEQPEPVTAAAG